MDAVVKYSVVLKVSEYLLILTHVQSYCDDIQRHGGVSDTAERDRLRDRQVRERQVRDGQAERQTGERDRQTGR